MYRFFLGSVYIRYDTCLVLQVAKVPLKLYFCFKYTRPCMINRIFGLTQR